MANIQQINESDTLSEGRIKINNAITKLNNGEFEYLNISGNVVIGGSITVNEFVSNTFTENTQPAPVFTLSEFDENQEAQADGNDRGIAFNYVNQNETVVKTGFFGWGGYTAEGHTKFKFIPEATATGLSFTGDKGIIDAKIEASDILNIENLQEGLSSYFVDLTTSQTILGTKTFNNFVILDNASQGNSANHALRAGKVINATGGVLINNSASDDLTSDVTLSLDSTVVKTSGNQIIEDTKTFEKIIASDLITGTAQFVQNGVYTTGNQDIFGSKVFRNNATQDGVQLKGRDGGINNYTVSITPSTLNGNRTVTLADGDTTLTSGTMMNLGGTQTIDGQKTFAENILFNIQNEKHGIQGSVNSADHWFVGGHASGGEGYAEIATGSGGNEPIYARQYNNSPLTGTIARTATLLDASGNTNFPGSITAGSTISLGVQASATSHAVRADRTLTTGDGLSGGGNLTSNLSFAVDNTVIRTTGNQTLEDTKTFANTIYASDGIVGNASTASKFENPVNINGTPFDGSQNVNINSAVDKVFYEGLQTVAQNYVVPTDYNAMAIGPIELANGVSITISEGSTFKVM